MVDTTNTKPPRPEGAESPLWITMLFLAVALLIILGVLFSRSGGDSRAWNNLLGLVMTLGIFTILYKDNPIFRFIEHIFVGLAAGFGVIYIWVVFIYPKWVVQLFPAKLVAGGGGFWSLIFVLLLGLLFFTVYFPKISWMNRLAIGILMGWSAGYALQAFIGLLAPQIVAAFRAPLTRYNPAGLSPENNLYFAGFWWHPWALLSFIVLLCTFTYFFFSIDHKRVGVIRVSANIGRYFLMITLGAIFGTTVMGRFSLVIERFDFIITTVTQWWGMAGHWIHALLIH